MESLNVASTTSSGGCGPRSTPPTMTVSWTQPENSPVTLGGGGTGSTGGQEGLGMGGTINSSPSDLHQGGVGSGRDPAAVESNTSSNSSVDNELGDSSEGNITWNPAEPSWPRTNTGIKCIMWCNFV